MDTKERLKRTGFTLEDVLHMYAPVPMTSDDLESWDGTPPNAEDGAEQYNAISSKNWEYVQAALKDKLDAEKVYTSKELYEILYGLAKDKDEFILTHTVEESMRELGRTKSSVETRLYRLKLMEKNNS